MNDRIILGFDPGVNGGICILWHDGKCTTSAFESASTYNHTIRSVLQLAKERNLQVKAFVEELTGTTAGSFITPPASFKLGRNVGIIEGLLLALDVPFESVRPQKWQKGLEGIAKLKGADKKRALKDIACRRYPHAKPTLKTADAILIADYGRKQ